MTWKLISETWEEVAKHDRVWVYTRDYSDQRRQFFDVDVFDLYVPMGEEDERPEECRQATHWMPRSYPTDCNGR